VCNAPIKFVARVVFIMDIKRRVALIRQVINLVDGFQKG
jgi:hypothetical protein